VQTYAKTVKVKHYRRKDTDYITGTTFFGKGKFKSKICWFRPSTMKERLEAT